MSNRPLQRVCLKWFMQLIAFSIILSGMLTAGIFFLTDYNPQKIFLAVFAAGATLGIIHTFFRYRSWSYEIRDDHVYLEHGVLVKIKTIVPFVRIQHVDTQRNILDRLLSLSTTVIYTAGSRGADVSIPGLKPETSESLQRKLRDKAIESEDRDGV